MTLISTLGQSIDQIERLKSLNLKLATYQTQLASGKKGTLFKDIGQDAVKSARGRADIVKLDAYQSNIAVASQRINLMTTALGNISQQAGNIVAGMEIETQEGDLNIHSIGDLSRKTLDFITNMINEKDGDRYLFAGTDTLGRPLTDTGTLDTYIDTKIDDWINGVITTDQLIDSYRQTAQLTDATTGYSAQLSTGTAKKVFVRVDETAELDYTVFANDSGLRDTVVAAKMLERLAAKLDKVSLDTSDPPGTVTAPGADQQAQNDNFFAVYNDLAAMFNNALDRIDVLKTDIGGVSAQISQISDSHKFEKTILQNTVDNVENVDINDIAVKISVLQTQLQASYQVTAFVRDLSLVNYLKV